MYFLKSPFFLLILIVLAFLGRELFLTGVFPAFTGQDEARHYNSVQWMAKPGDAICLKSSPDNSKTQEKNDLNTYRFTEEIREVSNAAELSTWREENYHKTAYSPGNRGNNEETIQNSVWSRDSFCPPDLALSEARFSFFHWLGSTVERAWENSDPLSRFYLVRILSVFLGIITIAAAYFAAREAGFSSRISNLIALIVSLQPRLSIYTTNINYDVLLIPCFALFLWAGLRCLRQGMKVSTLLVLVVALTIALFTKGTSLVLMSGVIFLAFWFLFKNKTFWKHIPLHYWPVTALLLLLIGLIANNIYPFLNLLPQFSLPSLFEYFGKSLPRIPSSSESFWGTLSWNQSTLGSWFVYLIWILEALALYGLLRFLYRRENPSFLPEKSVVLFCLTLIISLQIGIRFYDWRVFQETGSLVLGTPGRYFLPTLVPQLILLAVGLGTLLKHKRALERTLAFLAVIMLAFNLYTVWLIIIPRFYL